MIVNEERWCGMRPCKHGEKLSQNEGSQAWQGTELRGEVELTGCILCTDTDTISSSKQFGFWTLEKPS